MQYSVSSDFLEHTLQATVHQSTVQLANGTEFTFEKDETTPGVLYWVQGAVRTPIVVMSDEGANIKLSINGYMYPVQVFSERDLYFQRLLKDTATKKSGTVKIVAPMPGLIKTVQVQNGQQVKKGERLFILEAMKMENDIKAPFDGVVSGINVSGGVAAEKNHVLCFIEAKSE